MPTLPNWSHGSHGAPCLLQALVRGVRLHDACCCCAPCGGCSFFLLAFAIVGVELFRGRLRYQCYDEAKGLKAHPGAVCTCPNMTLLIFSHDRVLERLAAGEGACGAACPVGEACLYSATGPYNGATSFDDLFDAVTAVLQSITLEGWSDLMHQLRVSQPYASPIYFILLVVFGSLFVLNLYVVVMSTAYANTADKLVVEERERATREADSRRFHHAVKQAMRRRRSLESGLAPRRSIDEHSYACLVGMLAWLRSAARGVHRALPGSSRLRLRLEHRQRFDLLMTALVVLNTLCLAMEFYGTAATAEYLDTLQGLNWALTGAFVAEMVLRILAYGPIGYCLDPMNLFDAAVVLISLVEVALTIVASAASSGDSPALNVSGLRILRVVRVFRALKLARAFKGLRRMLTTIVHSARGSADLAFLLFLFVFIFALLGRELFAGRVGQCSGEPATYAPFEYPRDACIAGGGAWRADADHFDDLSSSLISVVVIFVGENWNEVWHSLYGALGWFGTFYALCVLVVGNFMILNLLLGIILGAFSDASDEESGLSDLRRRRETIVRQLLKLKNTPGALEAFALKVRAEVDRAGSGALESLTLDVAQPSPGDDAHGGGALTITAINGAEEARPRPVRRGTCGGLCGALRRRLRALVESSGFEWLVLILILLSSVSLALDDPRQPPESPRQRVLFICDFVFCCLFTGEAMAKIAAFGLLAPKHGYLASNWNRLDLAVVLISWASLATALTGARSQELAAFRGLRALRPLRLVHHVPAMRVVVTSIFLALPACANVAGVLLFFLLVFAILGMQFFAGTFARCDAPETASTTFATRALCEASGHAWYNDDLGSFDNVISAMVLLFEMMTTEMWPSVLHVLQDATQPGYAPSPGASTVAANFFCLAWIFIGALFIGNLFIGVLIDEFERLSANERGFGQITTGQTAWVMVQQRVLAMRATSRPPRPDPTRSPRRAAVYDVVIGRRCERLVASLTLANALLLGATHLGESAALTNALMYANFGFNAIWVVEVGAKLYCFGCARFFRTCRFDFALALAGMLEILCFVVEQLEPSNALNALQSALRLLRLLRLIRTVQAIPQLRKILLTLVAALPSLAAVVGLMVLVIFIYGLLGLQLFHQVAHGEYLTDDRNFESLPLAMLTLLSSATGESWNGIMHDLMIAPNGTDWLVSATGNAPRRPVCALSPGVDDCGSWLAVPYFVSYMIVTFCLLLNAAIAVLLSHFAPDGINEIEFLPHETYSSYAREWSRFDPAATCAVQATALPVIIRRVPPPLGVLGNVKKHPVLTLTRSISHGARRLVVHPGGLITFHETLMVLAGRHFAAYEHGLGTSAFAKQHNEKIGSAMHSYATSALKKSARATHESKPAASDDQAATLIGDSLLEIYAATLLSAATRGHLARSRLQLEVKQDAGAELLA